MKRVIVVLAALFAGCICYGQIPKLRPIKNTDQYLMPVKKANLITNRFKEGYVNNYGFTVIRAVFDEAWPFERMTSQDFLEMEVAKVRVGNNWGYITKENVYLLEPVYSRLEYNSFSSTITAKGNDGKYSLFAITSRYNDRLKGPVLAVELIANGLSSVRATTYNLLEVGKDGKYGILDMSGKWILPCEYDECSVIHTGNFFLVKKDRLRAILDKQGETILDFGSWEVDYGDVINFIEEGYTVSWDESHRVFIVKKGNEEALVSNYGYSIVEFRQWDFDLTSLLDRGYDDFAWDEGLDGFVVKKNGYLGRLDNKGNEIYPCMFTSLPDATNTGIVELTRNGIPSVYTDGGVISVEEYDELLYKQLSPKDYVETNVLPYWFKKHIRLVYSVDDVKSKYDFLLQPVTYKPYSSIKASSSSSDITKWQASDGRPIADYFRLTPGSRSYLCFWEDDKYVYVASRYVNKGNQLIDVYDKQNLSLETQTVIAGNYFADICNGYTGSDYSDKGETITDKFVTFDPVQFNEPASIPILRYHYGTWDGTPYAFLDNNNISGLADYKMPLTQIEAEKTYRIGHLDADNGSGVTYYIKVHGLKDNGIARYEIQSIINNQYGEKTTPKALAYGFIGLKCNYFTEPVFETADDFSFYKASVSIGNDSKSLSKEELKKLDPFVQVSYTFGSPVRNYSFEKGRRFFGEEPFQLIEDTPQFMGGDPSTFSKWVAEHLMYPEIAKENGIQGKVIIQFTINRDGSVTNVQVVRPVDPALDAEALRVIKSSPKWTPGKLNGRPVKVTYTHPIIFQLR